MSHSNEIVLGTMEKTESWNLDQLRAIYKRLLPDEQALLPRTAYEATLTVKPDQCVSIEWKCRCTREVLKILDRELLKEIETPVRPDNDMLANYKL